MIETRVLDEFVGRELVPTAWAQDPVNVPMIRHG